METIKFTLMDVEDILEEYEKTLENLGQRTAKEYDGVVLKVRNYRIIVPKLESSFRSAKWYKQGEAGLEYQENVWVRYPEEETDIDAWDNFAPYELYSFCDDLYEDSGMDYDEDELDEMECYLVPDEV